MVMSLGFFFGILLSNGLLFFERGVLGWASISLGWIYIFVDWCFCYMLAASKTK